MTDTGGRGSGNGIVWAVAGLAVVLALALAGVVGFLLAGGGGRDASSPTAADQVTSEVSPVREADTAAPPSTTAGTTSRTDSDAGTAAGSGCDEDTIAREAGIERRHVNVDDCRGDWAMARVDIPPGEPVGDPGYILRRSGGTWSRYTGIPSTLCGNDAIAEGMPESWAPGSSAGAPGTAAGPTTAVATSGCPRP